MKITYTTILIPIFLLGCIFTGFGQQQPKKPIKNLIKFSPQEQKPLAASRQLLSSQLELSENSQMTLAGERTDRLGYTHKEFHQFYKGIKVEFSRSIIHSKNEKITAMSNAVFRIKNLSTTASLSSSQAFSNAVAHVGAQSYLWENKKEADALDYQKPEGELVILPPMDKKSGNAKLAYKFDIYATQPLYRADVYIDANSGDFLMENKRIRDVDFRSENPVERTTNTDYVHLPLAAAGNVAASGESLYNGTVNFTAEQNGSQYTLNQTAYGQGVNTYDLHNGTSYSGATTITSNSTFFNESTGVQAHYAAEQTYQYYNQEFSRNSFDDNGAAINSYIRYSVNYVNAYWDGQRMTYGDGDGVDYGPLVSLDIVGHELTHAVTEHTANLVYQDEAGALNESFSDIQGESIEHFATGNNDWLMGDDIGIGGSGALRSMSNPKAYNQPDTYKGNYWYTGYQDNGGVHTNSGVQNYWFYLTSEGGSGTNDIGDSYSVSGIGIEKAAAVAYRNLTVYMNSYGDYSDARDGAIQAAIDLYGAGSEEEIAVTNAWYAVGVGSAYDDGGNPTPPTGDCISGDVYLSLTFDNYPQETSWELTDANDQVIKSQSYGSSQAGGSTVNITFSDLDDGEYTFTIHDQYGDGICCSYGSGAYTLSSDDRDIFSGGDFGYSEATSFCIDNGEASHGPEEYCDSEGNNSAEEWIDYVALNNMTHSSGNDGGYADNTDLTANLPYGSNTVYLSAGFSYYNYTEYWKVWIDYNHDGTFDNSEVVASGSSSSSATLQATFAVPNSAMAGTTRMRVSMKYNASPSPCEAFNYGEVEDYTVNIGQNGVDNQGIAGTDLGNNPQVFSAQLYPNPVRDLMHIQMKDNRKVSYEIYDLSGRILKNGSFEQQTQISASALSPGVYFIEFNDGQKSIVKKFIKR